MCNNSRTDYLINLITFSIENFLFLCPLFKGITRDGLPFEIFNLEVARVCSECDNLTYIKQNSFHCSGLKFLPHIYAYFSCNKLRRNLKTKTLRKWNIIQCFTFRCKLFSRSKNITIKKIMVKHIYYMMSNDC